MIGKNPFDTLRKRMFALVQNPSWSRQFRTFCSCLLVVGILQTALIGMEAKANTSNQSHRKDVPDTKFVVRNIAARVNTPPVDAKIDRIWKAIPALNGIQVDEGATYEKLLKHTDWSKPFVPVCKQLSPNILLDQLKPHGPIYRGNEGKKQMALMINVAWGEEYIPSILDTLQKEKVKATFFFDGSWLAKHHDLAKLIAAGHDIGNHGYHHLSMDRISAAKMEREIVDTNDQIQKALGRSTPLFAPPSGAWNQKLVEQAARLHMRTILWTLDTVDWKKPPAGIIVQRIVPRAQNGAMVLMHPTKPTAEALKTMIPALKAKGYDLVTVTELLSPVRPLPSLDLRALQTVR